VQLPTRHPAVFFTAILCVSAALAALALWIFSRAHTPFDYMVVGTLAATAALVAAFVVVVKRKLI
jgi:membrane associated rhomboid family serine protease